MNAKEKARREKARRDLRTQCKALVEMLKTDILDNEDAPEMTLHDFRDQLAQMVAMGTNNETWCNRSEEDGRREVTMQAIERVAKRGTKIARVTRVEVSTAEYAFAHGRDPRGRGSWAFYFGEEIVWIPGSMTYGEAKKEAIKLAKQRGFSFIKVAS